MSEVTVVLDNDQVEDIVVAELEEMIEIVQDVGGSGLEYIDAMKAVIEFYTVPVKQGPWLPYGS